jgi:pimeloyl-ACP methyl ester carboxylesterase
MKNLRIYGDRPYSIAVLHGGPGYPGTMAPIAQELSSDYGVLEPLQTADTIDGQVAELADVLRENADLPVILIGWSWGSMLALITAARHPELVRKLVLVCGAPLEEKYVTDTYINSLERLSDSERAEVFSLEESIRDGVFEGKNDVLARLYVLYNKANSYELLPQGEDVLEFQADIAWSVGIEVQRLYDDSRFLDFVDKISCPVTVIHGNYDPRPIESVKGPLSRILKDFRFILLDKCGHTPWYEKYARDKFYEILRKEIEYGLTGSE